MNAQEKLDLETLNAECDKIRKSAFNAMRNSLRMTESELRNTGYKSANDAAIGHFKFAEQKIEKLTKDFLKKYPDEKVSR